MSHQSELIATDIDAYLAQHEQKELLRFLTCGSVDDGKSTLIGRLLHDSKMIYEDQLAAIESDSAKHGTTGDKVDLALLVDGLQAEREQGITIDVAYRYFSTTRRKFIIADTPGHEQYTRNMVTGASTCDLAVILIDARYGVQTQTRRHSYIASLLGIKHIIVAINKMDLVEYSEERFKEICNDYYSFALKLGIENDIIFIPISALEGDNVVELSENMAWFANGKGSSEVKRSRSDTVSPLHAYDGRSLMQILESVPIAADMNAVDFRFPVQYVNRPNLDFRGYCGTIASGFVRPGDAVKILPAQTTSRVKEIITYEGALSQAFVDQSITLTLEDELDVSRGDMIVLVDSELQPTKYLRAHVVWMSEEFLAPGKDYLFKFASKITSGYVEAIHHQIDVNTQEHLDADHLELNAIGLIDFHVNQPAVVDPYAINRGTGAFIIIDRISNITVGAGMIVKSLTTDSGAGHLNEKSFSNDLLSLIQQYYPERSQAEIEKLLEIVNQHL